MASPIDVERDGLVEEREVIARAICRGQKIQVIRRGRGDGNRREQLATVERGVSRAWGQRDRDMHAVHRQLGRTVARRHRTECGRNVHLASDVQSEAEGRQLGRAKQDLDRVRVARQENQVEGSARIDHQAVNFVSIHEVKQKNLELLLRQSRRVDGDASAQYDEVIGTVTRYHSFERWVVIDGAGGRDSERDVRKHRRVDLQVICSCRQAQLPRRRRIEHAIGRALDDETFVG